MEYEPSNLELGAFALAGGNVTTGPWKNAIYGFGGSIQYDRINIFAQNCSDLILVEKDTTIGINDQVSDPIYLPVIPEYSAQILLFAIMCRLPYISWQTVPFPC